jgi:predicted lactoylglutathione lyase
MSDWGRKVWVIIIIKLFIMFVILKIFFFQDFLYKNYHTDKERSEHVLNQLTNSSDNHDRKH